MKVTIIDIAKKAGVSRTTVSNALNGNTVKCSEKTRKKIVKIAKELGYQPNLAAKTLVTNKSNLIGVIFPTYLDSKAIIDSSFYSNILKGIQIGILDDPNKDLITKFLNRNFNSEDIINWIRKRNLEGLIGIGEIDKELVKGLEKIGLPVVLIDNYSNLLSDAIYVNTDDEGGGYTATKYLLNSGYKNIAYCTSEIVDGGVNYKRYLGYKKAIDEFNKKEFIIEEKDLSFDIGINIAKKIDKKDIDGVFCSSDTLALGVMKGLNEQNVKIPEDIGIVGFDNISFSRQSILTLTTIDQDIVNKGIVSVKVLIKKIQNKINEDKRHIILPFKLVEGESTKSKYR